MALEQALSFPWAGLRGADLVEFGERRHGWDSIQANQLVKK